MSDKYNPIVYLVDDNSYARDSLSLLIERNGLSVKSFDNALSFLNNCNPYQQGCLILDIQMPIMSGLELQEELKKRFIPIPVIFLSGHADVSLSSKAFKAGAFDFLEKPFYNNVLIKSIHEAIAQDYVAFEKCSLKCEIQNRYLQLTDREKEVMRLVVKSYSSKEIAQRLKISHRTIETHRAHLMKKMQAENLADLIVMAISYELIN
jgi:two-component system, LuxR family, response regulator FixJ